MLNEMRAFAAVAEAGSIQAAAARLFLTQSAVTRQIQRLESELGAALLDRRTKPPELTATGRDVLERCRAILQGVAELKASSSPDRPPAGRLRVGVGYVLADDALVACLHDVNRRFRQVAVNIKTDWHHVLIELVRQNRLDAAIIPKRREMPLPPDVKGKVVGTEPLVFVSDGKRSLPRRPTLAQLAKLPWIVKPRETGTREMLEAVLARSALPLNIASEVQDENLQISLVRRGLGVALVTQRTVRRHLRSNLCTHVIHGQALDLDIMMIRGSHLGSLGPAVDLLEERLAAAFGKRGRRER